MGQNQPDAALNELRLQRESATPLYLQIAQGLARLIKQGLLLPGQRLPGSRVLAGRLGVHRNTLLLATDELQAEGWVHARARSGLFVNDQLPLVELVPPPQPPASGLVSMGQPRHPGFAVAENRRLEAPDVPPAALTLVFDDGAPDPRLSPLRELGRAYQRLLRRVGSAALFTYGDPLGDKLFRQELARYLREVRALHVPPEQVLVTRGSSLGLYLLARTTLRPGDVVVTTELNYRTANQCFDQCGAQVVRVPVDEKGLDTPALARLLVHQRIRLVYITSHHHYPTTVTLAPERRLHLYELARTHGFYLLEDDYDFDYHYLNRPTLPLASLDPHGLVVYIGSYSKVLYPGIRVGFVVAPPHLLRELGKYRRLVDRQGDHLLERALGHLLHEGVLARYLRKARRHYRRRKELFCQLLRQELGAYVDFREPEGGLAVWVRFKPAYSLPAIAAACRAHHLYLSDGEEYCSPALRPNACRMGFASLSEAEIRQGCALLKQVLTTLYPAAG